MAVMVHAHDVRRIQKLLPTEKAARLVAMRALNRAMAAAKTQGGKEISKEYAVRQRKVAAKVTTTKASTSNLRTQVTWRGGALNLADFSVTPGKPQPARRPILRATVARRAGKVPYKGAFLLQTRAGVKAFRRTSEAKQWGERYPVTGVWGPAIPQLLGGKTVSEAIEVRARQMLESRLEHEINRELLKGGRGRA